ncbi:MAG: hypothetical protein H6685_04955 [Deltaproteobacteria bacterium]|nr:hypothetical protein [Deltaproteobacteria bacterium]
MSRITRPVNVPGIFSAVFLVLGHFLWIWTSVESFGGPPFLTYNVASIIGDDALQSECTQIKTSHGCGQWNSRRAFEQDTGRTCIPCLYRRPCSVCMTWTIAPYLIAAALLLGILSVAFCPYPRRTMSHYHLRLPLIVIPGIILLLPWWLLAFLGLLVAVILMKFRVVWFPIPADYPNPDPTEPS